MFIAMSIFKIVPLNTAHDGIPDINEKENSLEI